MVTLPIAFVCYLFFLFLWTVGVLPSVVVAIFVSVFAGLHINTVQDYRHLPQFALAVEVLDFSNHRTLHQATANKEHAVCCILLDNMGVCNNVYRRTVNEYVFVLFLCLFNQLLQAFRFEQLCWVGRNGSCRYYM